MITAEKLVRTLARIADAGLLGGGDTAECKRDSRSIAERLLHIIHNIGNDIKIILRGYKTTVEFSADASEAYLPDILPVKVGKTYCVNWNGIDYIVTAERDDTLGIAIPALNSGGNFKIVCLNAAMAESMGIGTGVVAFDGSMAATLSIYATTVHALPVYYLPKMTVNVTLDASTLNCTADKTTREITDAIKAGYFVECRLNIEGDVYVLHLNRYVSNPYFSELFDTYFTSVTQGNEKTVIFSRAANEVEMVSYFVYKLN